jgi:hypothetical protein
MSQPDQTRLKPFAVAAAAVAIAAILVAGAGAGHDARGRRSPEGAVSEDSAPVVVRRATAPASRQRPGPISERRATRIARRFAASWQSWDTGRRSPHVATTLQRLSAHALWRRLHRRCARPTAARPSVALAFESVRAVASGRGIWRAPLIGRQPQGSYLGTLVIATTSAGPRVTAMAR